MTTSPTRILVTDDDPLALKATTRLLASAGYEVFSAANGEQTLKLVEQHHPDMMLLDVVLPDIEGTEICRRIKADMQTADIFIILLSGIRTGSDEQSEGMEGGADGYIARPIANRELLARVQSYLRIKTTEQKLQEHSRHLEEALAEKQLLTHELETHQIELEMQNDELIQARTRAETLLGQYTDLYDFAPAGYFTLTRDGTIKQVNLAGASMLGVERGKLIKRSFGLFIADQSRITFNALLEKVFISRQKEICEVAFQKDGYAPLWAYIEATCSSDGEYCSVVAMDTTGRKLAARRALERAKELQAFFNLDEINTREGISLDDLYREFANVLPKSWQYIESAFARIVMGGREYRTENFAESAWTQSASIRVNGMDAGTVEVGYLEEQPEEAEGPFLKEERQLINAIAKRIGQITERKQAESAMRASAQEWQSTFDATGDAICLLDNEHRILRANRAMTEMFGMNYPDMIGKRCWGVVHGTEERIPNCPAECMRNSGKRENLELVIGAATFDVTVDPIFDENNKVIGIVHILRDITQRKQAEEKLRASEAQYRLLAEHMDDVIWLMDIKENKFVYISPSVYKLRGYTPEEVMSQPVSEALTPESAEIVQQTMMQAFQFFQEGKEIPTIPVQVEQPCKDGTTVWTEAISNFIFDKNGFPIQVIGLTRDITERKQAEQALRENEIKYRALFETAGDAILLFTEGRWVECNAGALRVFGCTREQIIGAHPNRFSPPLQPDGRSSEEEAIKRINLAIDVGPQFFEWEHCRADATTFAAEVALNRLDLGGKPYIQAIVRDVSERKQAEDALRENEERLALVLDGSQLGYWDWNIETGEVKRNKQWAEMLGYTLQEIELSVKQWSDLHHPDDRAQAWESIQDHLEGRTQIHKAEYRMRTKDGKYKWILDCARVVKRDAQGRPLRMSGTHTDITERKQAEERLRASEARLLEAQVVTKVGSWETDLSTLEVIWSAQTYKIFDLDQNTFQASHPAFLNFVHPEDREKVNEAFLNSFDSKDYNAIEHRIITTKGVTKYMEERWRILRNDQEQPVRAIGTCQDITERKKAEGIIEERNQMLLAIHHVTLEMGMELRLPILLKNILKYAESMLNADRGGGIYLYAADENVIRLAQGSGINQGREGITLQVNQGVAGRVFQTSQPMTVDDYTHWNEHTSVIISDPPSTVMGVPLFLKQRVIGVLLLVANSHLRKFTDQDVKLSEIFAAQAAIAIQNAQMFETAQKEIRERRLVEDTIRQNERRLRDAQAIGRIGDWEIDMTHGQLYYSEEMYKLLERDPALGAPEISNAMSYLDPEQAEKMQQLIMLAMETGEGWDIDVRVTLPSNRETWHHEIGTTIKDSENNTIKILGVVQDITERKLAENQINKRIAELEMLYESGLTLNQILNPVEIGQKIIQLLEQIMDWHHTAIRLHNPQSGRLELLAFNQSDLRDEEELQNAERHLNHLISQPGRGLSGWAYQNVQIIRSGDVINNPLYLESFPGMKSGLYVPMKSGQSVIGVISIESEKPNAFTEADERLVSTLSNQAAIALENARLNAGLEQRVKVRTAEVEDLYNNAPTGYHSLDENGAVTMVNQTELNWLGYTREELLGKKYRDLFTPQSQSIFDRNFPIFKAQGWITDLEFDIIRKDGSIFPIMLNATAIYDADGKYSHSRSTIFDIAKRKSAEEALRENRDKLRLANIALEKAAHMKDEFLASMSHELRTPLTGILGLSEAMQLKAYGELNDKQNKALLTIEESGHHLLDLINDILDLSKIEAGKLEMQFAPCSLADICQASLQLIKGMAGQKNQNVQFSLPTEPIIVNADARRLKQILVNLLGNAVKFTPREGELGLEVLVDKSEKNVKLTVWDKGIGIKAEDMPKLFMPFTQLDGSLAREYTGTGLGLSLVKRLTDMHNGEIKIESTFGEGSRFTIILPWSSQNTTPIAYGFATRTGPLIWPDRSRVQSILIADDNETLLRMLADFLETRQYHVIKTRSGAELLERAAEFHPCIMLVDIQMPGMDGLETIRRIRAHTDPQVAATPVIAVTALAMPDDRERCLLAGANDYMSKPVKLKELVRTIQKLLEDKQ